MFLSFSYLVQRCEHKLLKLVGYFLIYFVEKIDFCHPFRNSTTKRTRLNVALNILTSGTKGRQLLYSPFFASTWWPTWVYSSASGRRVRMQVPLDRGWGALRVHTSSACGLTKQLRSLDIASSIPDIHFWIRAPLNSVCNKENYEFRMVKLWGGLCF